jgi:hypothetical protein
MSHVRSCLFARVFVCPFILLSVWGLVSETRPLDRIFNIQYGAFSLRSVGRLRYSVIISHDNFTLLKATLLLHVVA